MIIEYLSVIKIVLSPSYNDIFLKSAMLILVIIGLEYADNFQLEFGYQKSGDDTRKRRGRLSSWRSCDKKAQGSPNGVTLA